MSDAVSAPPLDVRVVAQRLLSAAEQGRQEAHTVFAGVGWKYLIQDVGHRRHEIHKADQLITL